MTYFYSIVRKQEHAEHLPSPYKALRNLWTDSRSKPRLPSKEPSLMCYCPLQTNQLYDCRSCTSKYAFTLTFFFCALTTYCLLFPLRFTVNLYALTYHIYNFNSADSLANSGVMAQKCLPGLIYSFFRKFYSIKQFGRG